MRREMKDRAVSATIVSPVSGSNGRSFYAIVHKVSVAFVSLVAAMGLHAQPARDLTSDAVGSTAGVFRVDESGQATYSIGIAVPPGTAGVTPTISLDYSSQGSTSVLGKGWSIGGQSSIGRCRKTREAGDFYWIDATPFDGNPVATGLNNGDAFCLDGQRLLLAPSHVRHRS